RLLSEVMVRNRRNNVGLQFTRRWARTERLVPTPGEQALYEDVASFIRPHLRQGDKGVFSRMALLSLQMALGSSSPAAASTLLATESGTDGRNLHFAHSLCNFDLRWNPMRIEQRIVRLSRIGKKHDIQIFNLVTAGTVEEAVLHPLQAKLNLFELVIGEIDI